MKSFLFVTKELLLVVIFNTGYSVLHAQVKTDSIEWQQTTTISNESAPANADSTWGRHVHYGSQYARLLKLANGIWIAGYTIAPDKDYNKDSNGGLQLQISQSRDGGKHWVALCTLKEAGRDLDNAQMIQLKNGSLLLACRSVRWQESYRLPVYKSDDKGKTWNYISMIDANEGKPGELGKPDKGIYEPHFYIPANGKLSVMYANENT